MGNKVNLAMQNQFVEFAKKDGEGKDISESIAQLQQAVEGKVAFDGEVPAQMSSDDLQVNFTGIERPRNKTLVFKITGDVPGILVYKAGGSGFTYKLFAIVIRYDGNNHYPEFYRKQEDEDIGDIWLLHFYQFGTSLYRHEVEGTMAVNNPDTQSYDHYTITDIVVNTSKESFEDSVSIGNLTSYSVSYNMVLTKSGVDYFVLSVDSSYFYLLSSTGTSRFAREDIEEYEITSDTITPL